MGTEFELKYTATAELHSQLLHLSSSWQSITMETTYYDTPSLSLSARRFTLRRRLENGISICTVKTPLPGNSRGEWEIQADTIEEAIPGLCKLGASTELASLTAEGVIAVCGARFERKAAAVSHGDSLLEIALDVGELFSGNRYEPLCEIEVELKAGSELDALTFGKALERSYGLQPETRSKFRRALKLRGIEPR